MRRKQTALLITLLILGSMAFVSQTRPQSSVSSTDPITADRGGPPVTDEDNDRIPDLHESIFGDTRYVETSSGTISVRGLDPMNSTDNMSDHDRDGASALLEFCWPYTLDTCFDRLSLTGKPPQFTESGLREYLDPRVSDTDGDGLPDGYEIHMCTEGGLGYQNATNAWQCLWFDPLDPSDSAEDIDSCEDFTFGCGDGFDVNRDGFIDFGERYTNSEEYLFGTPDDWITERDGLWCAGEIPGLTKDSCQDTVSRPTGNDGWLGSDPTHPDSDYYAWSEIIAVGLAVPGDGIPDGWEVYYGLDPRNSSDAIVDTDLDGWDLDRDGFIVPDISIATVHWGEAFSNYEEYTIHHDDGAWVTPGLRGGQLHSTESEYSTFDQSTTPGLVDGAVHSVISDSSRDRLLIGSRYGITVVDPFDGSSALHELPPGLEMYTMERWSPGDSDFLLIGTNAGFHFVSLDNGIPDMSTLSDSELGPINEIVEFDTGSGNLDLIIFGNSSSWTLTMSIVEDTAEISDPVFNEAMSMILSDADAEARDATHVPMFGRGPLLLVGTDAGLIAWNTTDGSTSIGEPWWVFDRENSEEFVQRADLLNISKSAIVNSLVKAGPLDATGQVEEVSGVWVGTAGGLHLLNLQLLVQMPHSAFDTEQMYNLERWSEGANDIRSILPMDDMIYLGSRDGTWCLEGGYDGIIGLCLNQTRIPGLATSLTYLEHGSSIWMFAGISPGRYMNIMPIDPTSADSDLDGMPDGWEFIYGLDPTDPYDRYRDADADGVSYASADGFTLNREWSNLDEYRFVSMSEGGFNGSDPRDKDSDGDGLTDGEEYWGWFAESTNFDCHYLNDDYICDEETGDMAEQVHLEGWLGSGAGGGTDGPTDPTNPDTDGDGMPDGWEMEHRRWIGDTYNGGNLWTLDPRDPSDKDEDADGDGLSNLCEYLWSNLLVNVLREGLPTHGETSEAAKNWTATDPNNIDSDGDSLPDGWEARYTCSWSKDNSGINPLNGSDYLNNPDGDGYDVDRDGILSPEESLVNWLEYHLKSSILYGDQTAAGEPFPENFTTSLWNETWMDFADDSFGDRTSLAYSSLVNGTTPMDVGSANPLSADSDRDGMPDGWEFYFARWSLFDQGWTLNPVDERDRIGDPDGDGMNNWEEYNVIDSNLSETDQLITVPQFYLLSVGGELLASPWLSAQSSASFGTFLSDEQINKTGRTADPNNPDTDNDGLLDGIELIFTRWNSTDGVWTLNPLVAGDGHYDSDRDGLTDLIELNLTLNNPANGGLSPPDAPRMWEEAEQIDSDEAEIRLNRILFNKEGRAELAIDQFQDWQDGGAAQPVVAALLGALDPNEEDTDRDGMSDGYEYWFTEWNLEDNSWEMNPLTDSDIHADSDGDSFDCNGDGYISDSESFDNLAEYDARVYGKRIESGMTPNDTRVSYGADAVNAQMDENGLSYDAAFAQLYVQFSTKSLVSAERAGLINEVDPDTFNYSLAGVSDPTDDDSDRDGMPDGWEFCYSIYGEFLPVNAYRWSMNPINPLDTKYDPDADGWYDRSWGDTPAQQGSWEDREFTPAPMEQQIGQGFQGLYFGNLMEYENGTHPLDSDSDDDSMVMKPIMQNGIVIDYVQDTNLSDGREVFKYGTNPLDNDTDGDMMPDFYEYYRGWNEANDNWSSYLKISVVWQQITATNWKPVNITGNNIARPELAWTWFTHDATDPTDSGQDADNDGSWDCSSGSCTYVPYNNFQEYYGIVNASLASPSLVRAAGLYDCSGNIVQEWWQLRESLLGTCSGSSALSTNYFRMYKVNDADMLYALIIDDNDVDYLNVESSDDTILVNGAWADEYQRFAGDQYHLPNTGLGEYVYGWWYIDIDGDQIADGTDPANWDTDGDWLNDFFEIEDDMLDGVRGNSGSPIRYDDRTTS
ncbi:MAG: hypothetical protein CMA85_01675 [Euryarchaeota archaeon]|nr:hypothetical protein [Euryarchaeota archaeon]